MGNPRRIRKKYRGPGHPWQMERLEAERGLRVTFGLKNKKEIFKADSKLRRFKEQAKRLIRDKGQPQAELEKEQLMIKLHKMGLVDQGSALEDVLSINPHDLLDRRLQSVVERRKMALTSKQARQFIVHGHILVNGKKVDAPSYLVSREEEEKLSFNPTSSLSDEGHPERAKEKKEEKVEKPQQPSEVEEAKKEIEKLKEIEKTVIAEVKE